MSRKRKAPRIWAGPYWLQWRQERKVWEIAWYDRGSMARTRRVRRIATGIQDCGPDKGPSEAAVRALFDHFAASSRSHAGPTDAFVEMLLAEWLEDITETNVDPVRAANCVVHLLKYFEIERASGRINDGPRVSHVNRQFCRGYYKWRLAQPGRNGTNITAATVDRELAVLRAALNFAEREKKIDRAPFVLSVPAKYKCVSRSFAYTPEEVAKILEAAARHPSRRHIIHFIIIMLSTHSRAEAVLALDIDKQVKNGCIDFLPPGKSQTKKRRSTVRMAPTLVGWIDILTGKAIEYRTIDFSSKEPRLIVRDTKSIRTGFNACLIEAGLYKTVERSVNRNGNRQLESVRIGLGGPTMLRHTIATRLNLYGIPKPQIDTAAGHAPIGTNAENYVHLRPEYLTDFMAGIERFWEEVEAYTQVHRLPHCYPKLTLEEALSQRQQ
jgi:integrase